jgi:hypothetical protein
MKQTCYFCQYFQCNKQDNLYWFQCFKLGGCEHVTPHTKACKEIEPTMDWIDFKNKKTELKMIKDKLGKLFKKIDKNK